MKLGTTGITIVVSSGDDGAPGNLGSCDGTKPFDPPYPAASPYVTTVGATMMKKDAFDEANEEDPICK